jgi:hypothetical protein
MITQHTKSPTSLEHFDLLWIVKTSYEPIFCQNSVRIPVETSTESEKILSII